jgi:3',5'-cyclic-nucleotide phosphodiesterase
MKLIPSLISVSMLLMPTVALADRGFDVIVLGALGGIQDGNLSSYLIRPQGDRNAVTCDAGSLVNGLKAAHDKGVFRDVNVPDDSTDSVIGHAEEIAPDFGDGLMDQAAG